MPCILNVISFCQWSSVSSRALGIEEGSALDAMGESITGKRRSASDEACAVRKDNEVLQRLIEERDQLSKSLKTAQAEFKGMKKKKDDKCKSMKKERDEAVKEGKMLHKKVTSLLKQVEGL